MKKLFFAFFAVLFTVSAVAQTGLTCEDPIPVDTNYTGSVDGPCELWYTASTYDLPLNVHFIPDADDSNWWPEVYVDLTCTPGVYADPKIDSIIRLAEGFDITFPVELACGREVNPNTGKVEWDLFVDAMYREQLAEFGVTYNVPAYVKVVFYEAGTVTLNPDTAFSSCMSNAQHVVLDDSISVIPNDSDRVFMMPYTDWQNDSIQFIWTGEEPAYIYMAESKCEFEPELANHYVWARYIVEKSVPYKVSNKNIVNAITNYGGGGLFYSKILSSSIGKLVVEKIPLQQAQGAATLLEYGKPVQLAANDTNALFCFPKTWTATQFISSSAKPISIYTSSVADFLMQPTDANVLAYYDFSLVGDQRDLSLSSREMKVITDQVIDDYVYVRFSSKVATTITAYEWDASACADESTMIVSGNKMTITNRFSNNILRLRYDDWRGYDITLDWRSTGVSLPVYIADTCAFILSSSDAHVVHYKSIPKKSVYTIPAATVDSWADRVDSDGFLYVRLNPSRQSSLYVTSARPESEPEGPCVTNSIELNANAQLTLNLDSAFTVYRINYAEWVAQNVTFQWTGETDLHTFLAETCQFAVAPYNRYVVDYVAIPANGEFVLDVETLSAFADKVDEDGYLYIRFLTEKEGSLSVTNY